MPNNYNEIILYGFSNIQIKQQGKNYQPLIGGISVQANITTESVYGTNMTHSYCLGSNTTAEGELTLLELTLENKALLFGHTIREVNDMKILEVSGSDKSPIFSLKFEREKANGKKIIYELPSVSFKPNSIEANTIKEGELEESNITLTFDINKVDGIYYRIYEAI